MSNTGNPERFSDDERPYQALEVNSSDSAERILNLAEIHERQAQNKRRLAEEYLNALEMRETMPEEEYLHSLEEILRDLAEGESSSAAFYAQMAEQMRERINDFLASSLENEL